MTIAIGSDHAGFSYKQKILDLLQEQNYTLTDVGVYTDGAADYPDVAEKVTEQMLNGNCDRGILICGSGIGVSVAANKFKGIRAGVCHDAYSARQGVEHDDMNVLCVGERIIGIQTAKEVVQRFLEARFSGEPRHLRRLNKVLVIEEKQMAGSTKTS